MQLPRIILHIDMDAFFAAIEERDNPRLKGLSVVVGSDPKNGNGRGVVSTANYIARKLGIHSALPITRAWRYANESVAKGGPATVFLPVRFKTYIHVSESIMKIIASFSLPIETTSVDEAYVDASSCQTFVRAWALAQTIKERILTQERLTCSIGIAPNKLLAKIASDMQKPNGLTIIKERGALLTLAKFPVRTLPGIGPKTEQFFHKRNIFFIKDLQTISQPQLKNWLGKWGSSLYYKARGIDERPLETSWEQKSLGHQETLPFDTLKTSLLIKALREMTQKSAQGIVKKNLQCKTMEIVVRFADFETKTRAKTVNNYTSDYETLWQQALTLFLPFLNEQENPQQKLIRLLGVSFSRLQKVDKG